MKLSALGYELNVELNKIPDMTLLTPTEYNASYFDGRSQASRHNAGYGQYERWYRNDSEFWKDKAAAWVNHLTLAGKKVLEIGCAKGFLVKDLRDAGVDAYGLDISSYAINACEDGMLPFLTVGDARLLSTMGYVRNEFDVLITSRFLDCLSDAEVTAFNTTASFISKKQVHLISPPEKASTEWYNVKTAQQWLDGFSWPKGTVIAEYNAEEAFLTK